MSFTQNSPQRSIGEHELMNWLFLVWHLGCFSCGESNLYWFCPGRNLLLFLQGKQVTTDHSWHQVCAAFLMEKLAATNCLDEDDAVFSWGKQATTDCSWHEICAVFSMGKQATTDCSRYEVCAVFPKGKQATLVVQAIKSVLLLLWKSKLPLKFLA